MSKHFTPTIVSATSVFYHEYYIFSYLCGTEWPLLWSKFVPFCFFISHIVAWYMHSEESWHESQLTLCSAMVYAWFWQLCILCNRLVSLMSSRPLCAAKMWMQRFWVIKGFVSLCEDCSGCDWKMLNRQFYRHLSDISRRHLSLRSSDLQSV